MRRFMVAEFFATFCGNVAFVLIEWTVFSLSGNVAALATISTARTVLRTIAAAVVPLALRWLSTGWLLTILNCCEAALFLAMLRWGGRLGPFLAFALIQSATAGIRTPLWGLHFSKVFTGEVGSALLKRRLVATLGSLSGIATLAILAIVRNSGEVLTIATVLCAAAMIVSTSLLDRSASNWSFVSKPGGTEGSSTTPIVTIIREHNLAPLIVLGFASAILMRTYFLLPGHLSNALGGEAGQAAFYKFRLVGMVIASLALWGLMQKITVTKRVAFGATLLESVFQVVYPMLPIWAAIWVYGLTWPPTDIRDAAIESDINRVQQESDRAKLYALWTSAQSALTLLFPLVSLFAVRFGAGRTIVLEGALSFVVIISTWMIWRRKIF